MIRAVDALSTPLAHQPVADGLSVTPGVTTGSAPLEGLEGVTVGVWEHSAGTSTDIEEAEVFVAISGRGRVTCEQGGVIELSAGVVGVLDRGARTTWEVTEPLRKVWISRLSN